MCHNAYIVPKCLGVAGDVAGRGASVARGNSRFPSAGPSKAPSRAPTPHAGRIKSSASYRKQATPGPRVRKPLSTVEEDSGEDISLPEVDDEEADEVASGL